MVHMIGFLKYILKLEKASENQISEQIIIKLISCAYYSIHMQVSIRKADILVYL